MRLRVIAPSPVANAIRELQAGFGEDWVARHPRIARRLLDELLERRREAEAIRAIERQRRERRWRETAAGERPTLNPLFIGGNL